MSLAKDSVASSKERTWPTEGKKSKPMSLKAWKLPHSKARDNCEMDSLWWGKQCCLSGNCWWNNTASDKAEGLHSLEHSLCMSHIWYRAETLIGVKHPCSKSCSCKADWIDSLSGRDRWGANCAPAAAKGASETRGLLGRVGANKEAARGRRWKLFTSNSKHKLLFFLPSVDTADQTLCHWSTAATWASTVTDSVTPLSQKKLSACTKGPRGMKTLSTS